MKLEKSYKNFQESIVCDDNQQKETKTYISN